MFTGIDFEKAIDYYRKGKEVIVLDRASVGKNGKSGYDTFPFEELFKDLDFLVDVPAVVNPDFEQAVQEMTGADQVDPEEIIRAVHETQESITPPPPREAGREDGRRNGRSSGKQYQSEERDDSEVGRGRIYE